MRSTVLRVALGMTLAGGIMVPALFAAEEATKALPTLLIKGEVVSVDANDPSAVLLKVKDRYGFETPIYLPQEAKITQGDKSLVASNLAAGTAVEVEYNFDINTAKRHAVTVKVVTPTAPAASSEQPVAAAPAAAMPAMPAAATSIAPVAAPMAAPAAAPAATPAAPAPAAMQAPVAKPAVAAPQLAAPPAPAKMPAPQQTAPAAGQSSK